MQIAIPDAESQTYLFILFFIFALLVSVRKSFHVGFSKDITNEVKGFAILTVIFGHIGYFLSTNHQFLFPLSTLMGVGVDLFLILSGFGLTISSLQKPLAIHDFYLKRLKKIYEPMWITVIILLILDAAILQKTYSPLSIIQNLFGWFPVADIYQSLNSPLWFITLIVGYYILYPLVTYKRLIYISPFLIFAISYLLVNIPWPFYINPGVLFLFKMHLLAFPLGMLLGLVDFWYAVDKSKFFTSNIWKIIFIPTFVVLIAYLALHSGYGQGIAIQELISIFTSFVVLLLFLLMPIEIKFLELIGVYSYEIYLIHWPLLYRYDFLYRFLPASIATFLYLFVLLALGKLLHMLSERLGKITGPSSS